MDLYSTGPDGQKYQLPTEADNTKEFERISELADQQRAMGREIVVVIGLGFVGSVMAGVVAVSEDEQGQSPYFVIGMQRPSPRSFWKISYINKGIPPVKSEDPQVDVIIARTVRPLMVRLFPEVPADHPAMGAMILNISANALGLGNAATPFGIRAMDSMRLEKSYRMVGTELSIEYSAYESAMDRFVKPDKGEFLGRDALLAWRKRGIDNLLVSLEVHDVDDADALGNNALLKNGELVGRATGGGFGFRVDKSLALGMVGPDFAAPGTELEIEILGKNYRATVIPDSPFDPDNEKLRDVNGAND